MNIINLNHKASKNYFNYYIHIVKSTIKHLILFGEFDVSLKNYKTSSEQSTLLIFMDQHDLVKKGSYSGIKHNQTSDTYTAIDHAIISFNIVLGSDSLPCSLHIDPQTISQNQITLLLSKMENSNT